MNFWQKLPKQFFCVAPMADVTDAPFRRVLAKYSKTSAAANFVTWTEFVSADGLVRATEEGKKKLLADLQFTEQERPIVAQLFTSNPEHMEYAARLCAELGFDGIDINMGCPDRSIEKQGCGAAMIKTPEVARAIIAAAKKGAGDLPVSVKTRLGYSHDQVEEWITMLLNEDIAALTVHARTRKEMSKVPARWERIKRVVEIRDELGVDTVIIGNGDVLSLEDGRAKAELSRADGIMVGRALFGNPWFFNENRSLPHRLTTLPTKGVNREEIISADTERTDIEYISLKERLTVLVEHSKLFEELLPFKNFSIMKKHYKAYVNGFPCAAHLRATLMEQTTADDVEEVVHDFLKSGHTVS